MAENGELVVTDEHTEVIGPASSGKTPFLEGSFAMFATDNGDVILATSTNLMGDQTMKVPRFVVNQAKRGNPTLAAILNGEKPDGVG